MLLGRFCACIAANPRDMKFPGRPSATMTTTVLTAIATLSFDTMAGREKKVQETLEIRNLPSRPVNTCQRCSHAGAFQFRSSAVARCHQASKSWLSMAVRMGNTRSAPGRDQCMPGPAKRARYCLQPLSTGPLPMGKLSSRVPRYCIRRQLSAK